MKSFTSIILGLAAICAPVVQAAPNGVLNNPNANSDAKALMAYLLKNYGSKSLSGQQEQESIDWVTSNIGKTPAVGGFDLMDYSPSRVAFGTNPNVAEQAIAWAKRGGIVTFCWHWGSPTGAYNSASQPWYSNFYTAATSFDVAAAMNNQNGNDYKLILRDIDAIAVQLKKLQSAGVPVLWRPLHEANGGWFWWGAKGPDACKKLYNLLFDRLTNYHQLNNLIWVWNSDVASWYPGNNRVDIMSTDIYASAGNHDPQVSQFNNLKSICGDTKIIAIGECGVIPNFSTSAPWSYWVTWNGNFIKDGNSNSRSFLQSIFTSPSVLTLDEISGWKSGGGGGPNPTTTRAAQTTTRAAQTTTRAAQTTTRASGGGGGAPLYGQCGGQGYTGPTTCAAGTCTVSNQWYSQCL